MPGSRWKEYENEVAVLKAQQKERERIAADMHDELGSGLTAIRFLSELTRKKMKENTPVEIEKIAQSADEVLNKLNAIIWSMHAENDSLESLITYIKTYAEEYFENSPIECKVFSSTPIADREMSGEIRRNISLSIKEILANAWKHSGCNLITIEISAGSRLLVRITDNGRGLNGQEPRQFGNGLRNITRRMESIGGSFSMETLEGTVSTLILSF